MIRENSFTMQRQAGWEELEELLRRANGGGVRKFDGKSLERLAFLYRSVTADLATAQTRGYKSDLIAYLNRLTARGHACVYAGAAHEGNLPLARFFTTTFPREVRASGKTIAAAAAVFIVSSVLSYVLVVAHPQSIYALLPAEGIPLVTKSLHDSNFAFDRDLAPMVSAMIITNNIQVAALAFSGGMTLGILTVWELIGNGLMTGGMSALFGSKGFGLDFFATIAPHGFIELTAIQISGGAGLLLASAILAPGRLRRVDALRIRAQRAGVLIIGVIAMLLIAGVVEGFVSPQRTSIPFRLGIGATTAALLVSYFTLAGRDSKSAPAP